jgi:hypothetical protein
LTWKKFRFAVISSALVLVFSGCQEGTSTPDSGRLSDDELRKVIAKLEKLEPKAGFSPIPATYVPADLPRLPNADLLEHDSMRTVILMYPRPEGRSDPKESALLQGLSIWEEYPQEFRSCSQQLAVPTDPGYLCEDLRLNNHEVVQRTLPVADDELSHSLHFRIGDVVATLDFTWKFVDTLPAEPTEEMREEAIRVAESMLKYSQ